MDLTIELLQTLQPQETLVGGSLGTNPDNLRRLYEYSVLNRMPLPYLEALAAKGILGRLANVYEDKCEEFSRTVEAIGKAAGVLGKAGVNYAFHKTVRPYRSTTVDIDTLILGDKSSYLKSVKTMLQAGYRLVERGPRSTTVWDGEFSIGVDLYEEIAVSYITYVDKKSLEDCIIDLKLPNSQYVKHLDPEADLVSLIAHSIIKEQMYPLSEYYSFIHYLERIDTCRFLQMVKESNIVPAARTHATITASIHAIAYKNVPIRLRNILVSLGQDSFEMKRLTENRFKAPHKYHPITILKSLLKIAERKKTRDSMALQIFYMANPDFTGKFLKTLTRHATRRTY